MEIASVTDRDSFRSLALRLQAANRTAGMRLSIPDHLTSEFKILEHEGYLISQRRPGTKRSIKFNDMTRSLVMDIKLPGMAWVRINPELGFGSASCNASNWRASFSAYSGSV